uniref:Uncharacterized protein n=1 Tax=Oryza meridionalis TaxID=40149 RepID=A0A0E0E1S0_9ORYZ
MAGNMEQSAAALVWGYETGRRNGYCDQWRRKHSTVHREHEALDFRFQFLVVDWYGRGGGRVLVAWAVVRPFVKRRTRRGGSSPTESARRRRRSWRGGAP